MMRTALLGLALALGMNGMAQAQGYDADRQLETFTTGALKSTLGELGATYRDREGVPNISVEFANGLKADALLMACDDQATASNCLGTSILATFAQEGKTDAEVAAAVSEYNYRQNFGRAYVDPNGEISLRMYIIADGGITMDNYRNQIGLFAISMERFLDYLYE